MKTNLGSPDPHATNQPKSIGFDTIVNLPSLLLWMIGKNILSSMLRVSFFLSLVCLESSVTLSSLSSSPAEGRISIPSTGNHRILLWTVQHVIFPVLWCVCPILTLSTWPPPSSSSPCPSSGLRWQTHGSSPTPSQYYFPRLILDLMAPFYWQLAWH